MVNNYTSTIYNTNSKYKDIDSVTFNPLKKVEYKKIRSIGDKLWWKWLGFIPLIPYKAKANRYEISGGEYYLNTIFDYPHGATLDEIRKMVECHSDLYFMDGLDIFAKATVKINFISKRNYEYHYFKTNEEAMKFVDNLKSTCKKVGNELN